jgi:hypothetical protein
MAVILAICAIPHAIMVYTNRLPTALLSLHLTACVVVSIHAELRRQSWKRSQAHKNLVEIVAAADGTRR